MECGIGRVKGKRDDEPLTVCIPLAAADVDGEPVTSVLDKCYFTGHQQGAIMQSSHHVLHTLSTRSKLLTLIKSDCFKRCLFTRFSSKSNGSFVLLSP